MYMPKTKSGYQFIVAARDDLSNASEGRKLKKCNSQNLADFFYEQIFCRYGCPLDVVTDNGPECKGAFDILCQRLNIPQIRVSPYNSKANGVVERGHFTIREAIIKACKGNLEEWPNHVERAFFADRVAVSSTTGHSPFFMLHGVEAILPFDLYEATFLVSGFRKGMSSAALLALRMRQLERRDEDLRDAGIRLLAARHRSKAQFERRFHSRMAGFTFKTGDLVLMRNKAIEMSANRKSKPRYLGPFCINRQLSKSRNWVLETLDGKIWRRAVAEFLLVPYELRDDLVLPELKKNLRKGRGSLTKNQQLRADTRTSKVEPSWKINHAQEVYETDDQPEWDNELTNESDGSE